MTTIFRRGPVLAGLAIALAGCGGTVDKATATFTAKFRGQAVPPSTTGLREVDGAWRMLPPKQ